MDAHLAHLCQCPWLQADMQAPICLKTVHFRLGCCYGWGCSSVGRTSDWHATEAGSVPWCGRGFFSQSQLLVQTVTVSVQPKCAVACVNVCAHVKDPKHLQPYLRLVTQKYRTHCWEWVALLSISCCSLIRER